MSFVSYAQNFEDVILWRALKHVENGFYIDIGAQHPVVDSVSLAFYEHGWRGVHVEPTQQYSDLLREARPDETVFQVAIGKQEQRLSLFEFEDTGLSTADAEVARKHRDDGFKCREVLVPVLTLEALLQQLGAKDIHWLKVDVEGLEKEVLESWAGATNLPWIVVVESTLPRSQEESHQEWECLLLDKGYIYVYFDGLNRFYVSPDHSELCGAFGPPPNIFDEFVLSASQSFCSPITSRALQAEANLQVMEERLRQADARAEAAELKAQQAKQEARDAEAQCLQAETICQQVELEVRQAEAQREQAEQEVRQGQVQCMQAEAQYQQVVLEAQEAQAQCKHAEAQAQLAIAQYQQAESRVKQLEDLLDIINKSTSWRVTGPMRWAKFQSILLREHGIKSRAKSATKKIAVPMLIGTESFVRSSPRIRRQLVYLAKRTGAYDRLRAMISNGKPADQVMGSQSAVVAEDYVLSSKVEQLTPKGKKIYLSVLKAMQRNLE